MANHKLRIVVANINTRTEEVIDSKTISTWELPSVAKTSRSLYR